MMPNYNPLWSLMIKNEMCPLQTADMHGLLFVLQAGAEESKRRKGGGAGGITHPFVMSCKKLAW